LEANKAYFTEPRKSTKCHSERNPLLSQGQACTREGGYGAKDLNSFRACPELAEGVTNIKVSFVLVVFYLWSLVGAIISCLSDEAAGLALGDISAIGMGGSFCCSV
jgi:hypothetical protein